MIDLNIEIEFVIELIHNGSNSLCKIDADDYNRIFIDFDVRECQNSMSKAYCYHHQMDKLITKRQQKKIYLFYTIVKCMFFVVVENIQMGKKINYPQNRIVKRTDKQTNRY